MLRNSGIGQAELRVLRFVQDHHPVTVRQVADHLARTRGLARTTAINVMDRLCRKKFLSRRKIDGVYRYAPRVGHGQFTRRLVADFVREALGGSVSPFVTYLASDANLSHEELAELKQLVRQLEDRGEK